MTQEEHNLLVENNRMLKDIIAYINKIQSNTYKQGIDMDDFILNVLANCIR